MSEREMVPRHNEIMTKWWLYNGIWFRVNFYIPEERKPYLINIGNSPYVDKSFFDNLESADIPPES